MTNQVIPAQAVEAAMRAFDPSWDTVPTEWRDYFLRRTRAALEAAAPHMLADAWDEGSIAGWVESGLPHSWCAENALVKANPYRSDK